MFVVAIFTVIAVALVVGAILLTHLGFRAGDLHPEGGVHRRLDADAAARWLELGRLSRHP
jgi:hypothetical protein